MGRRSSPLDYEQRTDAANFIREIRELRRRLEELERQVPTGLFPAGGTTMELPTPTETLRIVDAGSTGATEQDWVEVEVEGVTGYVRIFSSK
jgi:hypothetical protein